MSDVVFEPGRSLPAKSLELFFDYSCPYAYVASVGAPSLAARMGVPLTYKPFLLGGVFKARGTPQDLMNQLAPAKAAHNQADITRAARAAGVPLVFPGEHPRRTVEALRATLATGISPGVIAGFFRAYWVEGADPSSPETIARVVTEAGFHAPVVLAQIGQPVVKVDLRERTDEAIARGVFGAPTFFVDGKYMYWGQDRMVFVEGLPPAPARPTIPSTGRVLEAYWDYSSPFSYLAMTQVEKLAERAGAKLVDRPMLLGGIFKEIGQVQVPLASWSAARQKYTMDDIHRWAAYWGVPFKSPSRFPMNTIKPLRATLALPPERRSAFRAAVFHAYWADDRDIGDDAVLSELLGEGAPAVLARTQDPAVKNELIAATRSAVAAGVFGAPTFVIDGKELYWGQDRLGMIEEALRA